MEFKIRNSIAVIFAASAVANAFAQANSAATWSEAMGKRMAAPTLGVAGGSAPIEQALNTLVPDAYSVRLDAAVPRAMNLSWKTQSDWMTALREAVAPVGLVITTQWDINTITVSRPKADPAALLTQAAVAATEAQTPTSTPVQTWATEVTDLRLVDAFTRWAKVAGIQLRWDAVRHVELGATDVYDGDVMQAMVASLSSPSIANSDYPMEVCFYPNRPVLARVTRKGEQWRDCPLTSAPK